MLQEDMSLRHVAVGRQRQLVAKLNINNQEHWLYRVQPLRSAGHTADYYLLDANGNIVHEWLNADLADIKTEIRKMTTHQVNEDHFAPEQVEQIKACQDPAVQNFYKQYVQAEALGDRAAADRYAAAITKRCGLLGVFANEPTAEASEPVAKSNYQEWEDRMKAGGAQVFKTDAEWEGQEPTVSRAFKIVGNKHVLLGEFDLINDSEIFESAECLEKYTVEGKDVDLQLWTDSVLAEGATKIESFANGKVAYLGEARIGIFRTKEETPVKKTFGDILKESYTVNMNIGTADSGEVVNSVTVTADGDDATQLLSILKLSGLSSANARDEECCGDFEAEVTEEYSNSPDEKYASVDTQLNKMSGGLNKQKRMSNPNNPADNPLAMKKLGKMPGAQLNIEEAKIAESLEAEFSRYTNVNEDIDQDIRNTRAKINKLRAQKERGSPFGDVSKELANAKSALQKLLRQKRSGNVIDEDSSTVPPGADPSRHQSLTSQGWTYKGSRKTKDGSTSVYTNDAGEEYLIKKRGEWTGASIRSAREIAHRKQKRSKGQSGDQLDELSPNTYKNYIDAATGDYAHTNAVRQRTPRDEQTPLRDRMNKRNRGLERAQSGLDRYADDVMQEDVEAEGNIGDEVIITGNVQFNGATGVIVDFGQDRRFVIVDLYNHGKKSFHASDVSLNDYADSGEEQEDMYDRDEDYRNWASAND